MLPISFAVVAASFACVGMMAMSAIAGKQERQPNNEEKTMAQQVVIDQEECLGCEACVEICPTVFDFDGDAGKAFVKDDANAAESCVDEAIGSCPAGCISKE